jgi:putative phosphoesterase
MRILLVADIHGNWSALQAVLAQQQHDLCICLGDLVDYGLEPSPCVAWAREKARYLVRGNHDHGVSQDVSVTGRGGYRWLTSVTRPLTRQRLQESELRFLSRLPLTRVVTIEETRFFLVHATPRDPMDEYAPAEVDFWTRRLQNIEADVVCVGHTHLPYVLEVGDKLVINPGSVGQPRDGDPRASCAVIDNFKVDLVRIEYPVEETVKTIQNAPLPERARDLLSQIYRTGGPLSTLQAGRPGEENGSEPAEEGEPEQE